MKRTLFTMAVAIATAITIEAQTARQFILTNSNDGQSESFYLRKAQMSVV